MAIDKVSFPIKTISCPYLYIFMLVYRRVIPTNHESSVGPHGSPSPAIPASVVISCDTKCFAQSSPSNLQKNAKTGTGEQKNMGMKPAMLSYLTQNGDVIGFQLGFTGTSGPSPTQMGI